MKKPILFGAVAGAILCTSVLQAQTHYVYVAGGRAADVSGVPAGETADDINFQNILVADLDIATKSVTNWRVAGDLPTTHPTISPSLLHWSYLADNVNFLNNRIYVGPATFNTSGAPNLTTADFIAYADINPDGSLGAFSVSPLFPAPPTNQRIGATEIIEVDGVNYIYVMGGNQDEAGQTNRVLYAAIDNTTGAIGAWQTATAPLPSNEWFHAGTANNGTLIVSDGNINSAVAQVWTATPVAGGNVGSWTTTTYTGAFNQRWDNITVTASDGTNDYVYIVGGVNNLSAGGGIDVVNVALASDAANPAAWSTTSPMPAGRRRMAGAAIEDVIVVPGGATGTGFATGTATVFVGTVGTGGALSWADDSAANIDPMPSIRSFHGVGIVAVPEPVTSVDTWDMYQ